MCGMGGPWLEPIVTTEPRRSDRSSATLAAIRQRAETLAQSPLHSPTIGPHKTY
jgi:hypothetical protein